MLYPKGLQAATVQMQGSQDQRAGKNQEPHMPSSLRVQALTTQAGARTPLPGSDSSSLGGPEASVCFDASPGDSK